MDWNSAFDKLAEHDYAIIDQFFPVNEYEKLKKYLLGTVLPDEMKSAGIGSDLNYQVNKGIRSDKISWLDPLSNSIELIRFFKIIDSLKQELNRNFYLSISGYEFHFAHYGKGSFYKRHSDRLRNSDNRLMTIILYFNDHWKSGLGGELKMFLDKEEKVIEPLGNRLVIFRPEKIEHEVMLSNTDRYSITGWMLRQPPGLTFL